MHKLVSVFFVICAVTKITVLGYSDGAPAGVCDDMTPKHPFEPQRTRSPYTVSIGRNLLKPGEETDITISGQEFKGFFVQVRNGDKAVGSFNIKPNDELSKSITCHGSSKSAATHANASAKKSVTLKWKAPQQKGEYYVFVTVATDGATYWSKQNVGRIQVN